MGSSEPDTVSQVRHMDSRSAAGDRMVEVGLVRPREVWTLRVAD
jgi:hypothetical protein